MKPNVRVWAPDDTSFFTSVTFARLRVPLMIREGAKRGKEENWRMGEREKRRKTACGLAPVYGQVLLVLRPVFGAKPRNSAKVRQIPREERHLSR